MKEKVEQFAKGEYNVHRPDVVISVDRLQLNIEEGSVYHGSFEIYSADDSRMKAMVYDSKYLFKIDPHNFIGRSQEIEYSFDASRWEKGEKITGSIYIVTDGGEYTVPYEIEITEPMVVTSLGNLSDMFQFANLAESNWGEAVRIFTSADFKRTFLQREPLYLRVYESLTRSLSASQAMEEFLTYTHKKRSMTLSTADPKVVLPHHEVPERHSVLIQRNTWGYLNAEVHCDVRWLQLQKQYISTEDFVANKCHLSYMINPEYLGDSMGTGHIVIETVYQRLEIEVTVKALLEEKTEPRHLFTNHHMMKVHQSSLVRNYLVFRRGEIDLRTYVDRTMYALRNLTQYAADDKLYRLGILHMNILAGNSSLVEEEFKRIDADQDSVVVGDQESSYYAYLKALQYKEPELIEEAKQKIRYMYDAGENSLFYFWLLLFLDDSEATEKSYFYAEIERMYARGIHSPILYYEICDMFNHEPLLLRRLGDLELSALRWGIVNHYLSEDILPIIVDLAGREHGFQQHLFQVLQEIDLVYQDEDVLRTICGMLIRAGHMEERYHLYFERGVAAGFKLIGLHEAYIRSMDKKEYRQIPESVIRYLVYSNSLSDYEMAYVYASLIHNKTLYPSLFGELAQTIENYMETQIVQGNIHEFLLVIYREFLKPDAVNPKYAAKLTNIIFKRRLTCKNPNIRAVIVNHQEMDEEQQIALKDGVAYIDVITESAVMTLVDHKGNRYISTIPYQLERLVNEKSYLATCEHYNPSDPRLLAYIYTKVGKHQLKYAKDVNEARDVMECKALSYELRQQALLQIIEYYMTNYDGDILEKYLLQVDLKYLDKLHSAEIISGYIMRNMNRKAYEVIKLFGYQGVELPRLLRLASFVVTDTDIIGDEALTALCIYLYQKGQYNDRIISYLVFHYKSCTKELSRLWETAIVVLGEARELEENLLAQLIFADARLDNEVDIFTTYYNGRHRGMVTKAYLKRMAYKSFILEEWVSDRMYEYLLLEMKQGEIQDDICSCAILQHYAKLARLHEDEQAVVAKLVKQFLNRGIVLPFFKHFVEYVELPQEVFLKTYLVYKGEERQDVIVNYSVGTSELQTLDFKPCRMEERIPGYYVQEFVVFHGEQLLYHFSEEYQGHVEMIESDSIRNDVYLQDRPSSRFERLNQMLIDQEMRDDESLTEEMERYMKNQHVFEEIMRMV